MWATVIISLQFYYLIMMDLLVQIMYNTVNQSAFGMEAKNG
jgi:hypothetical protein